MKRIVQLDVIPLFIVHMLRGTGIKPPLRGDFSLSRTLLGLASASVPDTCGLKAVLSNFPLKREGFRPINSFSIRSG